MSRSVKFSRPKTARTKPFTIKIVIYSSIDSKSVGHILKGSKWNKQEKKIHKIVSVTHTTATINSPGDSARPKH